MSEGLSTIRPDGIERPRVTSFGRPAPNGRRPHRTIGRPAVPAGDRPRASRVAGGRRGAVPSLARTAALALEGAAQPPRALRGPVRGGPAGRAATVRSQPGVGEGN